MRFPLDIEPWMRFTRNVKESHKLEHFKTRFVQEYLEWHGKWNCWPGPQLIVRVRVPQPATYLFSPPPPQPQQLQQS